ncbi:MULTISPECIES: helix-turn-helix domain-containing protein [Streptococcus]|jgi:transcriptional regulator with XRE-family HTH domain|uniref:DNA-binding transcriptional regulator, XRE-family HTH domain n=1 Tax=Streptococcus equinus TaxID=1335 RepID=A0AAE8L2R0_STREI|nr:MULTISPECIES: helix-turn-helix transcriptional regulator [Streptococcus]QBX08079.1 DNA-binding protein [Streptococcus satellite phage Javan218]TDE68261.1 helix-turn-helix domain-containing protein [Streptococcus sp. KCJ4932]SDW14852.1 DNA-binding transcriptional regulator, XRE-family HTH domain [Streptococcus equinus]VED90894.1 XRE family transcriptional regulator [Streptococcus equinus]VTS83018.1 XRE family transcriptional regulator [Streptococcus equinus]
MNNKIKELRKKKKLTQEELAEKINVTKLTISRWERGERVPKSDKAQQLADFLGVSVSYLLGYSDYKNKDMYLEEHSLDHIIESDKYNAIETIGENNLPLVYKFLRREFEEEYRNVYLNDEDHTFTEEDAIDAVDIAMGNIGDGFWNLPDSLVKLIFYWATLKASEREQLLELIKVLSLNNLDEDSLSNDN